MRLSAKMENQVLGGEANTGRMSNGPKKKKNYAGIGRNKIMKNRRESVSREGPIQV